MSALMLRPGSAVEAVEEGLLFSGWQGSSLMVCKPGVAKVWRAVEPVMRGGFEAEALRARLPEAARGVCDVLVATLRDNGMLVPAPRRWAQADRTQHYLAHSAADPGAAAEQLAATVVEVLGVREQAAAVTLMLAECGISLKAGSADSHVAEPWLVWVGDRKDFAELSARPVVVAVSVGEAILVAPCETGLDRLRAAAERLPNHGEPATLTWAIARTVVVECVHRLLAGTSRPDRGFLIDSSGSLDVPLAPPRHDPSRPSRPSPMALADAAEWHPRDDTALLARLEPVTAERIGPFPAPNPGMLVQHPLARQVVGGVHGAGLDQARAGVDAVLCFLRDQVSDLSDLGEHPVAGDGPADLLADAAGRLAVAESSDPDEPWTPRTPISRRWVQAVTRMTGRAPLITTTRSRGAAVAKAVAADRTSWGYGNDAETAGEHATRGLLKALIADLPTASRTVVVSHESTAALPLLAVAPAIPENHIHLRDLGGGLADTGILVGTVGGRS